MDQWQLMIQIAIVFVIEPPGYVQCISVAFRWEYLPTFLPVAWKLYPLSSPGLQLETVAIFQTLC